MVKWLAMLCVCVSSLFAQEVTVEVDVLQRSLSAGAPVDLVVRVSRSQGMQVDPESFTYKGEKVEALHRGDASHNAISVVNGRRTTHSSVVSTYLIKLPPMEEGLHLVDAIELTVDGKRYSSAPEAVSIEQGVEVRHFKLEAKRDPEVGKLYPGQRLRVGYRIYFVDDVELTIEELPLLKLEGFYPIGDKKIATGIDGQFNVHAIAQDFEVGEPGTYEVPESVVEGYAYVQDFFGRRRYREPRLRATAPAQQIVVVPFPEQEKPVTFNGAVGSYVFTVSRIGTGTVRVGDKITLRLRMESEDPYMVDLPQLEKQPGFQGNFRTSDLPPSRQEEKGAVFFDVELRPLKEGITEIPAISWSYFEPLSESYRTLTSPPIPITVQAAPLVEEITPPPIKKEEAAEPEKPEWEKRSEVGEIEIPSVYTLRAEDLTINWWESVQALLLVPAGALLLGAQWLMAYRPKRRRKVSDSARELYRRAKKAQGEKAMSLLVKALHKRIEERGGEAMTEEIQRFLSQIEEQRFAGGALSEQEIAAIFLQADQLIRRRGQ